MRSNNSSYPNPYLTSPNGRPDPTLWQSTLMIWHFQTQRYVVVVAQVWCTCGGGAVKMKGGEAGEGEVVVVVSVLVGGGG